MATDYKAQAAAYLNLTCDKSDLKESSGVVWCGVVLFVNVAKLM